MKAVTANRLTDGRVVFLAPDGMWADRLALAARFEDASAEAVLLRTRSRVTEIAGAYLIEVDEGGAAAGREALRETIRDKGPTVRSDLGKQSGNG